MHRYICLHGHFYHPPRENPWLEQIEMQDSAYPHHDWNARISAECYAPNAASRILDESGKIADIVNNYAKISFNFGPTLLSWLEAHDSVAYRGLLEADQESRRRFSGHGSACAQAYNHMILPLANARDKATQVRWGIRDFVHRFGRHPEGMWLPETAVDTESLEALAAEGIRFTILSPYQAKRVRPLGAKEWIDVQGGGVDTKRAYEVHLPSGRRIAVFFYDGPSSRAVAFERLLHSGEDFARRLISQFRSGATEPELEHIATDGETYGHHHRHGEMALSYALDYFERQEGVELTVYGEFLERHPPQFEAEIVERTAWSCAHGVARWEADCGCNSGGHPGYHQRWRAPLRAALDWLRDEIAPRFEFEGQRLFVDPWRARDDYIEVVLNRSQDGIEAFLKRHGRGELDGQGRVAALRLMELQRHAMYMYTSCGWFFDDLAGIETVQVIEYAARAVQLAQQSFGNGLEEQFLRRLEKAESNRPELGNGRRIFERSVRPSMLDLHRVVAHWAVSSLFEDYPSTTAVYCYEVSQESGHSQTSGRMQLRHGRATVRSSVTLETTSVAFAAVHLGDHNVTGGVREFSSSDEYDAAMAEVGGAFSMADVPDLVRVFDKHFRGTTFSLKSLFRDRRREIIDSLLAETLRSVEAGYSSVYEQTAPLLLFLTMSNVPVPRALHVAAEQALNSQLRAQIQGDELDGETILSLISEASARKVSLDATTLSFAFQGTLDRLVTAVLEQPEDVERLRHLVEAVRLARALPFEVDLWAAQNLYFTLRRKHAPAMQRGAAAGAAEAAAWLVTFERSREELGISPGR